MLLLKANLSKDNISNCDEDDNNNNTDDNFNPHTYNTDMIDLSSQLVLYLMSQSIHSSFYIYSFQ